MSLKQVGHRNRLAYDSPNYSIITHSGCIIKTPLLEIKGVREKESIMGVRDR